MNGLELAFWSSLALVAYAYVGYPLLLALLARLRRPHRRQPYRASISIILPAHDEQQHIVRRLDELSEQLSRTGSDGEIIVVSDGSTDATAELAANHGSGLAQVLTLPERQGKSAALREGCAAASNDILVFADARQRWADAALPLLLENFADPAVGAVSGELIVETADGVVAGVGLYWRFEKWLRRNESRLHSLVGVTGAISAVRRQLFDPPPAGTLLDDVYWPLRVVMRGYRVVHDRRAEAYDRLPDQPQDEFRRKVRTLAGNYQLVARLPAALVPGRNPIWLQYLSHKLLRLLAPWALLIMLASSLALGDDFYGRWFRAQIVFYELGLLGLVKPLANASRLLTAAGSFVLLNAAAWCGFWVWLCGRSQRSWNKVSYPAATMQPQEAKMAS